MNDNDITTLEQVRRFLEGAEVVEFAIKDKKERYAWIQKTLVRFRYLELSKQDKGLVIRYLVKVSGYSRQQTTRLVAQYRKTGRVRRRQRTVAGFKSKYTHEDIRMLAQLDELHGRLSGPVVLGTQYLIVLHFAHGKISKSDTPELPTPYHPKG